jgi:capping protein beta
MKRSNSRFSNLLTNLLVRAKLISDQNAEISMDESAAREFLKHEYNRDGDSHRSPWSNTYFPACEATFFPSAPLLSLE